MRVMVLVKATTHSERGDLPDAELLAAMGDFNQELISAGVLLAADGLKRSAEGRRVTFDGSARSVSEGPFSPTIELVAGFWLWQVQDMDKAFLRG